MDYFPQFASQERLGYFFAFALVIGLVYRYSVYTNVPKIKDIPEIPGALPFIGHLHLLGGSSGNSDATVWTSWYEKYDWPVFQLRFGNQRVVIVNTFDYIKELWVGSSAALVSRPVNYIMEEIVGRDMGSAPWNETTKRQRQAAIKSVAPGTFKSYYPQLYKDSRELVNDIARDGKNGSVAIEPRDYIARIGTNLGFSLTYGKTLEDFGGIEFLHGFVRAASKITHFRVGSSNWVDYVPFLRLLPSKAVTTARSGVAERAVYLEKMFQALKADIESGKAVDCIGAKLMAEKEWKLTEADLRDTCISMLQGSAETISAELTCGIGSLCAGEAGLTIQETAYAAIVERWGTAQEAYDHAFGEEDIPYVVALYKEIMRYYCAAIYSVPRITTRDLRLRNGAVIPPGTTLYMNSEQGNHDTAFYGNTANTFDPRRWLDDSNSELSKLALPHLGYGAGARICPAAQISNRILYGLLIRLIVSFRITPSAEFPPVDDPIKYNGDPTGLLARPKKYLAHFTPRETGPLAAGSI